jgi:DNA repair protein RecO
VGVGWRPIVNPIVNQACRARYTPGVPTVTDNAIVIRRWDFSETSQTVSLLTREHGIIRGLAKGAKREKSDFSGGLDLLTEGEIVAIVKPGRDLATLTAWHLQATHRVLREHLPANRAAMYMADLVHHMLIDHDPHALVFDALSAALAAIDQQPADADVALLRLQWAVLVETGYQPGLVAAAARGGSTAPEEETTLLFSARGGGVIAGDEAGAATIADGPPPDARGWRVRRETIDLLRDLAAGIDISTQPAERVRRANRLLAAYCREIIGSEPAAMRWAFPDLTAARSR